MSKHVEFQGYFPESPFRENTISNHVNFKKNSNIRYHAEFKQKCHQICFLPMHWHELVPIKCIKNKKRQGEKYARHFGEIIKKEIVKIKKLQK